MLEILQQTENQLPTFMDDVYRYYINRPVAITIADRITITGILRDCNGCIVHLEGASPHPHVYIPYEKILCLRGDE